MKPNCLCLIIPVLFVPFVCWINQTRNCTLATVGDVGISITAFWTVAAVSKSRQWFHQPRLWQIGGFVLVGIVMTVIFEALATGPLNIWKYTTLMPKVPFLGIGLLPLLQWVLIPPIIIWFVKRQLDNIRQKWSKKWWGQILKGKCNRTAFVQLLWTEKVLKEINPCWLR